MKNALALLTVCLFLFSCQKEFNDKASNVKVPVKFNVSGFTQTNAPFEKLAAIEPAEKSYELFYVVYNSKGEEISRRYQKGSTTKFNAITDSLIVGTYTVVVTAGEASINLNSRYDHTPVEEGGAQIKQPLNYAHVQYVRGLDNYYRTKDLFYKKLTVEVKEDGTVQDVVLERMIGKIDLIIEDADKATHDIIVTLENEVEGLYLNTGLPWGDNIDDELPVGSYNIINTAAPIRMRIWVWDYENQELIKERYLSVKVNKNQRTIVRGKLFEELPEPTYSNNGFNITLSEEWGTDSTEVQF